MLLRSFAILGLVAVSTGYRVFQDRIPNGDKVPHPCKPNFIWRGVGHLNVLGGGARNPFGLDFDKFGKTWTKELCETDSDGDGTTNGEELGDPNCKWAPDTFPERSSGLTHPGVCDPWGSGKCEGKNDHISCETGEFNCSGIHEPHVRNMTLRFPQTLVPSDETTYMCMYFDLKFPEDDPPGQEYHLIATEPIIDNPNVMHHITLTGCDDTVKKVAEPTRCYMAQEGCVNNLGLWTLGLPGECVYEEAGFKIGGSGPRTVMLQFHWTNPEHVTNYWDESGMIIYYTTKLRKYNAGTFQTGQLKLEIPPGQSRVVKTATCSSECTEYIIPHGVYITTGINHMHYLGVEQNVELYRNGTKIADLTKDDVYSYDSPIVHVYDPPHLLLPGDRLDTKCVYRSLSKSKTTYFGEGSFDEMCFGIFTVFPIENVSTSYCQSWGEYDPCGFYKANCDLRKFYNKSDPDTAAVRRLVQENCNHYGPCRQDCPAAVAKAREHPCLQGDIEDYISWSLSLFNNIEDMQFIAALSSCDCPENRNATKRSVGNDETNGEEMTLPCIITSMLSLFLGLMIRS